jgi:pimeloyl-ACP methyl ester carboxylesterase
VDLRGHGRSGAPTQRYTVDGFADDVAWLCEQIGMSLAVLVGHSMGGQVVLDLAARHPDLVGAVVMVDAAPIVRSPDLSEAARAAIVDGLAVAARDNDELRAKIVADMSATQHHVAVSCLEHMGSWDGEAAARTCAVPILQIAAENPINDAAAMRALNTQLRTAQTAGAGHFNQLEVPDQVNAMIDGSSPRMPPRSRALRPGPETTRRWCPDP